MTHVRAHRDTSLAEHEDAVLAAWRMVAPMLLEGVLQVATSGLEKTARPLAARCPRCERRRGVQSQRKRQLQTRLGPIRVKRWWHHCWTCGRGWSPPDVALGLAPYQQTSTGLARWQAALGAVTTFREAARLLGDLAGVEVGSETLRTHAERIGTDLEGRQQQHLSQPTYVAAREPAMAFARRIGAEATRRGALDVVKWHPWDGTPAELRPVVVLGDGAKWIWEHVATLFGEERTEIVDWYHASEHIWTAAKSVHGDDTPDTKAWAHAALDHLWQTGAEPVLTWFDATRPGSTAASAALQREPGYFSSNAARMQYPSFRERHLAIGSGAVEASAKHLVQLRMKRAGSRWSDLGARAILDLRCHLLSGRSLHCVA